MAYTVENKSNNDIEIFVPNYPTDSDFSIYGKKQDTTLTLKPEEKIVVGIQSKIDFPWGTKNIYKNEPGKCGMKRISKDTIIHLGCSKSEWKFKKGNSNLTMK